MSCCGAIEESEVRGCRGGASQSSTWCTIQNHKRPPNVLFKDHKHPGCETIISSNFGFYSVYKWFLLRRTETQLFILSKCFSSFFFFFPVISAAEAGQGGISTGNRRRSSFLHWPMWTLDVLDPTLSSVIWGAGKRCEARVEAPDFHPGFSCLNFIDRVFP